MQKAQSKSSALDETGRSGVQEELGQLKYLGSAGASHWAADAWRIKHCLRKALVLQWSKKYVYYGLIVTRDIVNL